MRSKRNSITLVMTCFPPELLDLFVNISRSMQIQQKPKFDTPFAWIGGEANIKALVERFYDLMDLEPGYTALRAAHGNAFSGLMRLDGWAAALHRALRPPEIAATPHGVIELLGSDPNSPNSQQLTF